MARADAPEEHIVTSLPESIYGYDYRMLDWSPDGRWLAVSLPLSANNALTVNLLDSRTGEKRVLTHPDPGVVGDVEPRFSPDGRTLSFIRLIH